MRLDPDPSPVPAEVREPRAAGAEGRRGVPVLDAAVAGAVRAPWRTLALWAGIALLAGLGVARLHVETSTDSILSRADTAWRFYSETSEIFGGDEIVVAALASDEPFDPALLEEVRRITEVLDGAPGVRRVDSLASVPHVHARPDGTLELDPLIEDAAPNTPSEREQLAARVRSDRIAPRSLVSDDGRVLAVTVLMQDLGAHWDKLVVRAVTDAVAGRRAWITGGPVFRTETNARTESELLLFVPVTIAIIAVFLALAFRSPHAVWIPLATSGIGSWVLLGALGASGIPVTISTMILPSVLLALGCAYVMHMLTACARAAAAGERPGPEAVEAALVAVGRPIALSGLTTAIGFASMTLVRIDSIQYLGCFGAVGVLAVLAATLTVTPACLRLWPVTRSDTWLSRAVQHGLGPRLVALASRWRPLVFGVWALAGLALAAGLYRLEVETDVTRWFPIGTQVRDSYEAVRERLSGISPMNVVIEAQGDRSVIEPEALAATDALAAYLASLPAVGKVVSLADPLRQLHGGFTGDPALPLPLDRELVAQYLLLLESVEQIGDLVTPDRRAGNVLLRVDDNGSVDLLDVADKAERWWSRHGPAGFSARTTGIMYEYARAEDEIALGQIRGLSLAFLAIGVLLLVLYRHVGIAASALLPNALPILMVFGFMGLAGIPLDAGTVSVGCLALGVAVDDTIHMVTAWHERAAAGREGVPALEAAFSSVLTPLVYTTIAIALGFLVLGLSGFTFVRSLGLLTSGIMLVCLVADVTLLPALLIGRSRALALGRAEAA